MKVIEYTRDDCVINVTLHIMAGEFAAALDQAYLDEPERYTLPGHDAQAGPPPREKLEKLYGPKVLFDEALDLAIPAAFGHFAGEKGIWLAAPPEVGEVSHPEGGGVQVCIRAQVIPEVQVEGYKGIAVHADGDEATFAQAVMAKAVDGLDAQLPNGLIDGKLEGIIAQEKAIVNQDPIYVMLADAVAMLESAYRWLGVVRPKAEVRSEAMDVMLKTVSPGKNEPSKEHFFLMISQSAAKFRELPEGFGAELERMMERRRAEKAAMSPEQKAEEVFAAYMGSLEISAEKWLEQRRQLAIEQIKQDLLLDEVARLENIQATSHELNQAYEEIARQFEAPVGQIREAIPQATVERQLSREKALQLIVGSAIRL